VSKPCKFDLAVINTPDGLCRVAVYYADGRDDGYLPSVWKAHGTPWFLIVGAAVKAVAARGGTTGHDDEGLTWESKEDADAACAAAKKAAKGVKA
jgi:hypothetical protein